MPSGGTLEGIALDVLGETGCDEAPACALRLARSIGVSVRSSPPGAGAARLGDVVYLPPLRSRRRFHRLLAHELGHWCLDYAGEEQSEEGADYLADALLLPRLAFDRDLKRTAWNLSALRRRHRNATSEAIARRIVGMRDAVATTFEGRAVVERRASPWLPERFARVTAWEREIAAGALERGRLVQADELVYALPVPGTRRVVLVAEAEQLALRF